MRVTINKSGNQLGFTNGEMYTGLPLGRDDPRLIEKAARDRLAVFSPTSAPLLRPALAAEDVQRWHVTPRRFLIAIPSGWTAAAFAAEESQIAAWLPEKRVEALFAALAVRFPLLAKQLAAFREALQAAPHGEYWWELPAYSVERFANPAIIWPHNQPLRAAPMLDGTFLLNDIRFTTAPTAFLLGALNSKCVREAAAQVANFSAADVAALPIDQPDSAVQQRVGELAEAAVAQAQAKAALDQQVITRVLRDLAPAGATDGPRIAEWWRLSFEDFLIELGQRFKSDVPFRYRDGWRDYLRDQRIARQICEATIARIEAEIDEII